jgi:hypothetical protein
MVPNPDLEEEVVTEPVKLICGFRARIATVARGRTTMPPLLEGNREVEAGMAGLKR